MNPKEIEEFNNSRKEDDSSWVCPNCGRYHPGYKPRCCCEAKTERPKAVK